MSVYDSAKEEQPEWCVVLHDRSRWSVCTERYQPRSAVYEIDQTQVARYASALKKYERVK